MRNYRKISVRKEKEWKETRSTECDYKSSFFLKPHTHQFGADCVTWLHLWITLHIIHQNHKYCLHFFYCFFSFRFFIDYFHINAWQLSMFTANCRREQKKIVAESRSTENTFWHFPMKRMNITDLNCLQKLMLLFVFWEVITL